MSVIYIVFPLALVVAAIALGAFIWAVRSGQLDDLETPAVRAILDDDSAGERDPGAAGERVEGAGDDREAPP